MAHQWQERKQDILFALDADAPYAKNRIWKNTLIIFVGTVGRLLEAPERKPWRCWKKIRTDLLQPYRMKLLNHIFRNTSEGDLEEALGTQNNLD